MLRRTQISDKKTVSGWALTNLPERFRRRIESAAKGNASAPFFSIETILLVLSVVYGGLMGLRARLYESGVLSSKALPCLVVSIGNMIAGGTGKTPMTIYVAQTIRELGCRVVVISRGYRGRMERVGGIVSDGEKIFKDPEDAGDEPYLMAKILTGIPVVVGRGRYAAGMLAVERFKPDVVVLDDAFQHLRLKRDLNLVLLDSRSPLANGRLLPRGLLREPLSALRRADAIVFTRCNGAVGRSSLDALPQRWPVFYTNHASIIRTIDLDESTSLADAVDISTVKGKSAVAFAGLADNDQFFGALELAGCLLKHRFAFPDHHRYGSTDLERITQTAKEKDADVLITTFKDFVKIEHYRHWPVALVVVDVEIKLSQDDEKLFRHILLSALRKGSDYKKS